ncbi:hypothetical protein [Pseudoalteromonas obscura]|uniref:Uncharacterized protein n=1 Tax=Pseudoalteromonas obscura TaxID=3048491 RepID=A0ABT7EDU8_9GAMM|nr:hypothetical protein [Pseudoalteromonas sp. P94(2023)]MDK2593456.1 hypothetical protein [Pseudoalteromonas sp. P94(2023)]
MENIETICKLLEGLSRKYPDMRFGQLVTNVSYWANGPTSSAAWDVTDEDWIAAAKGNLEKNN